MSEAAPTRIALATCIVLLFWVSKPANCQEQSSHVTGNTFVSPANPEIRVTVANGYRYVGSFRFTIGGIAKGNRYVFVDADTKKDIRRMFIIQQEGFLPSSNDTYKYPIRKPAKLGGQEYQHNVFLDDLAAQVGAEPEKEAALTQRFLTAHGYVLEPELVVSRFARPADSKYEIIFFCFENLSAYGHKLADFTEGSNSSEEQKIKLDVDRNCRGAFKVDR